MKLFLVRHGQSEKNVTNTLQGVGIEDPLTKLGTEQAAKVAKRLANINFDYAFSSDVTRARKTAETIVEMQEKLELVFDERLREVQVGIYSGKPIAEIQRVRETVNLPYGDFKPEGGESFNDARLRSTIFFNELSRNYFEKTLLAVSHGATIGCWLSYIMGDAIENWKKYSPYNASVTLLSGSEPGQFVIDEFNSTIHL